MARVQLKRQQLQLLREALAQRAPDLLRRVATDGSIELERDEMKDVQGLIADELVATGLRDDDEPNERGLKLEDLIGAFSPYH